MNSEIFPNRGVGDLVFGMAREETRRILASNFEVFKRDPSEKVYSDYYIDDGFFVYFDEAYELEAVEFSTDTPVYLDGVNLFELNFSQIFEFLSARDKSCEKSNDGVFSRETGLSIYVPSAKSGPTAEIESIMVFKCGYYDT